MTARILLIDDNLPDRVRYRRMLQRGDGEIEIVEAEDASKGLEALRSQGGFDCVLLDQDLPDLKGLDLLDDIGTGPDAPPVVMLTGEEDAAISIDALRRGAADYLMKRRIDEDRLQRAVRGAIERNALGRELRRQQQRLSRFYRLANQTEDALFIVDAETRCVTDCNEAARIRLGLSPSDDDGAARDCTRQPPSAFGSPEAWAEFCERAEREGKASHEWRADDRDGMVIEITARRIEEEGHPFIVAIGRDVTLRKQREQALLERSLRDGLTGIWNRRAFDERLAESWRSAERHATPVAVILIDVDHFKFYNDMLGHPAGDECLRQVATALQGAVRSNSMLARYGGEEFVALIENADLDAARQGAERLRQSVTALALAHPRSSAAGHVTISIGIASAKPGEAASTQTLLDAADAGLYAAKRAGRDRVMAQHDATGAP